MNKPGTTGGRIVNGALFFLLLLSSFTGVSQAPSIIYSKLIHFYGPDFDENLGVYTATEIPIDSIKEGRIHTIKLKIKNHSSFDSYIQKSMPMVIIFARGHRRMGAKRVAGIDELNSSNFFTEMNELAEAGDRFVIDIASGGGTINFPITKHNGLFLSDIIFEAAHRNVYYGNTEIIMTNFGKNHLAYAKKDSLPFENGRVKMQGFIRLKNCRFIYQQDAGINYIEERSNISSVSFQELTLINCSNVNIRFKDCKISKLDFKDLTSKEISFSNSEINDFHMSGAYDDIRIEKSVFQSIPDNPIEISVVVKSLLIANNRFNTILALNHLTVTEELKVLENEFKNKVFIGSLDFPEASTEFIWDQLAGYKLVVASQSFDSVSQKNKTIVYTGMNEGEQEDKNQFNRLIKSYQKLYNHYKEIGDIESANACYAEKKDLEGMRLEFIYQKNETFKNYITWKLNRLMKFYTEHGTDPAKAILISVWVVVWFGVFYFFFPSDWDVSSKSRLFRNFKDFIEKNKKGYIRPFLTLVLGFIMSLINALTLSLNSFVTLGFGNIPTHGAARYVTILEGFIGWFLLSIFTVALINQVLA